MASRTAPWVILLTMLIVAGKAPAQYPLMVSPPPAPAIPMPPLLYVKLLGPTGMKATIYRGAAPGQTFEAPCTIGVRPGYAIRLALSGIPDFPGDTFFPTLEVRGSLFLANKLRNADFPAALVFTTEDFARIRADATLKKIIVLERPDNAVPLATKPNEPFEFAVPVNGDPLQEARERGQPLLVMHMGGRQLTREELSNVPGTVLLPGEKVLIPPQLSPWLSWNCFPVIDPRVGPMPPGDLMLVPNGGDVDLPAGMNRFGKLRGLDPSDTVAEYADSRGRQRLAVSNRIGLCLPRFIIVKSETGIASQVALAGPGALKATNGYAGIKSVQPPLENHQKLQLEATGTQLKASGTQQHVGTAVTGRIDNLVVTGTVHGTRSIDMASAPIVPEPEDGPLVVIKWPDRYGAVVGDLVTFTLKYTNSGGQPITNIAVSDSLTNRFEYVPGSSKTDREAIFTTQPNDAGSQVLRWQITGALQPRESGIVTFQVRIR